MESLINFFKKTHFIALAITTFNIAFKHFSIYCLKESVSLIVNSFIIISGLVIFFYFLKTQNKIVKYFSIYVVISLLIITGLIFRNLIFGIILTIVFFPFIPDENHYKKNGISIETPFQGLIAMCCSYQIKEEKCFIFEKRYPVFNIDGQGPINFKTIIMKLNNNEIEINYETSFDEGIIKKLIIQKNNN